MSDNTQNNEPRVTGRDIVLDLAVLMVIMCVLGYSFNLVKDCFTETTSVDVISSVVRKGGLNDQTGKDPSFLDTLKDLRQKYPQVINAVDNTGRNVLMWTCYVNFNNPESTAAEDMKRLYYLRELLDQPDIDVQAEDNDGFTAMHWAAWSGMDGCILELFRCGLDINKPEKNGYTPLMLAALRGNDRAVSLLLQLGADASLKDAKGETALDLATASQKSYAASEGRGESFYSPIYEKARSKSHSRSVELLQNPPPRASVDELAEKLAQRESSAKAKRMKQVGKPKSGN